MNGHLKEKLNSSRVVSSTANLRRKSTWQEKQITVTPTSMIIAGPLTDGPSLQERC